MKKSTVYLPDDLKAALELAAARSGSSEAELIRFSIQEALRNFDSEGPTLPLFSSGGRTLADRTEKELSGFGE